MEETPQKPDSAVSSSAVSSSAVSSSVVSSSVVSSSTVLTTTCECCGLVGEREGFYSTKKRFCSKRCAHSYSARHRKGYKQRQLLNNGQGPKPPTVPKQPSVKRILTFGGQSVTTTNKRRRVSTANKSKISLILPADVIRQKTFTSNFNWGGYLNSTKAKAAPVHCFAHAPFDTLWFEVEDSFSVEVPNLDCPISTAKVYWIATVQRTAGYKILLRYEGMGDNDSLDFWANFNSQDIKPIGWSCTANVPLCPPQRIKNTQSNWKEYLFSRLKGGNSLPAEYETEMKKHLEGAVKKGMRLEIMDKNQLSKNRIGIVDDTIAGRLHVRYEDGINLTDSFWCHEKSTVVHPIGWSESVGHKLLLNPSHGDENKHAEARVDAKAEDLFQLPDGIEIPEGSFEVGMKLEAIDPLKLSNICVATVAETLNDGYLMISIDGMDDQSENKCYCHHRTSTSIFPAGFCDVNNIQLTPPSGWQKQFVWTDYLSKTRTKAAPVVLFVQRPTTHKFEEGMKLEAVDLMEPNLICVATISRVVGNVLRVHFDGWEDEYDQWIDATSPNIFPVGWCELVGHELQPPNSDLEKTNKKTHGRKGRTSSAEGCSQADENTPIFDTEVLPRQETIVMEETKQTLASPHANGSDMTEVIPADPCRSPELSEKDCNTTNNLTQAEQSDP